MKTTNKEVLKEATTFAKRGYKLPHRSKQEKDLYC